MMTPKQERIAALELIVIIGFLLLLAWAASQHYVRHNFKVAETKTASYR